MLSLVIPGPPCAKARARVVRLRNGRVISFTPTNTARYENLIKTIFVTEYPDHELMNRPLCVIVRAYMPIPASCSKKRRAMLAQEKTPHVFRPDIDNVLKAFLDSGNKVIWYDDSQIYRLDVSKYYSAKPRLEISVSEMDDLIPQGGKP